MDSRHFGRGGVQQSSSSWLPHPHMAPRPLLALYALEIHGPDQCSERSARAAKGKMECRNCTALIYDVDRCRNLCSLLRTKLVEIEQESTNHSAHDSSDEETTSQSRSKSTVLDVFLLFFSFSEHNLKSPYHNKRWD